MSVTIQHYFPSTDVEPHPSVTILIPALNEEITIGEFVDWCKEGLRSAGVSGQILIVDSSSDKTQEIALRHGAEVLKVPQRGLGRAYIDAIPYVRSSFVIMGDADLTYDVRYLRPFLEKLKEGYEFVMGSRFKGKIEKGAMPFLHQYFGTPITTWILNKVYGCHFSDIHCGLRGVTLDALKRMRLQSQSWQYASEMIIKAIHLDLKCSEVPVVFHKDRDGRESHHKRIGWYAPWVAGWINLKAVFTLGADFFLYKLGMIMTLIGMTGSVFLANGPVIIGKIGLNLHWMLFFMLIFFVGLQFFSTGILAKGLYDFEMKRSDKWNKIFSLNCSMPIGFILGVLGIMFMVPLANTYITNGFRLPDQLGPMTHHALMGITLILTGVVYFATSLLFNTIMLGHVARQAPGE